MSRVLKKIISFILFLSMIMLVAAPKSAAAESLDFAVIDGVLAKYFGDGGVVTVPDGVRSVSHNAFYSSPEITSLTFPEGVEEVNLNNCTIQKLNLPDSLLRLSLSSVKSLEKVHIPKNTNEVDIGVMSSLSEVTVDKNNKTYSVYDNCLYSADKKVLYVCPTSKKSISIHQDTNKIGYCALSGCNYITEVKIPEGVKEIENSAFSGCSGLKKITFPDTVEVIGGYAFSFDSSLTDVKLPKGLKVINNNAFLYSSLKKISVASGNKSFSTYDGCLYTSDFKELIIVPEEKTSVKISTKCTSIREYAFYGSVIESITLPPKITEVKNYVFYYCDNLKEITLGRRFKTFNTDAVIGCDSLNTIKVNAKNTYLSSYDGALYNKKMTNLLYCPEAKKAHILNSKATQISDDALHNNYYYGEEDKLYITLPLGLKSLGEGNIKNSVIFKLYENSDLINTITEAYGKYSIITEADEQLNKITVNNIDILEKKSAYIKLKLPEGLKKVKAFGDGNSEFTVTYTSQDPETATVSSTGKVKGKNAGSTIIYATLEMKDGTQRIIDVYVTVKK